MKIIVDGMGGDHAPIEIVAGCVLAAKEYKLPITIVGKQDIINQLLTEFDAPMDMIEVINATEVITNHDQPARAIRRKKDSSLVIGMNLLKQHRDDGVFITSGSTGAALAGGLFIVGRIPGIDRPAIAAILPNLKRGTLLIDCGANAECKVRNLVEFAGMGSYYMEKVWDRKKPKVGLINIGTEESKGSELLKSAYQELAANKNINFVGNVEAREIPNGVVDIVVCDGLVGNVVLKLTEGTASAFVKTLRYNFENSGLIPKIGAFLAKPALRKFKASFDYTEYGGAPLLGINGGIIKAHGNTKRVTMKYAIKQGQLMIEKGVVAAIRQMSAEA